jgi:hypothetical protein
VALSWPSWPHRRCSESISVCTHCHGCFLAHKAYLPSEALPTLNSCFCPVSSGKKFCQKPTLLCAELWVILGCSLVLALGPNTDIHTEQSRFCRNATGLGLHREKRPLSSPSLGLKTSPHQGENSQAFRSGFGGDLLYVLQFPPKDEAVQYCPKGSRSLPSLGDSWRWSLSALDLSEGGMQSCVCLYLCPFRSLCICLSLPLSPLFHLG